MNYRVRSGDTLGSIAARFNVGLDKLLARNPAIKDPDFIRVGQSINVPGRRDDFDKKPARKPETYTVRSGDTMSEIAEKYHVRLGRLVRANPQIDNPNVISVGDRIKLPGKTDGGRDRGSSELRRFSTHRPPANYSRVPFRGVTVDKYTRALLLRTEAIAKKIGGPTHLEFWQGSFNPGGVAASGGTHDGGGAVDVKLTGMSQTQIKQTVRAMRMAGFAAWSRGAPTFSTPHIHAIAIGDAVASPAAKLQVQQYFNGQNGLADYGVDGDRDVGRPVPKWARQFNR